MKEKLSNLRRHVEDHCSIGSEHKTLGIRKMPIGYALMLNPDRTHYYWLRHDGTESVYSWNKWDVYRGAKADAEKNNLYV